MSVVGELRAPAQGQPAEPDTPFDRTPPQDIAAEQSVLGGMLLSKDAIADVVEILRSTDFYRPAHATIFEAVLDLYGRGDPADPITVTASLTDAGTIGRVGGMSYVHDLVHAVPTAANTAYYARIVAERAVLRRLVEAGTRIVQLGYGAAAGAGRDVDDVVDLAQQAVYDVTERRVSEDFLALADVLQPTLDEIEAIGSQGGVMTGVPTGFADLDALLNGLHPGQLIVVAGRPGLGKALALDTPLPTPDGWTTMAQVSVGDQLIDARGRPTTVLAVSAVLEHRPCYAVEFSDGSVIVADGEHRWLTHTHRERRSGRPPRVVTTEEIRATLRTPTGDARPNHSVPHCRPLALPARELPAPPYAFGARLGARPDASIPPAYLRGSEAQRRALLAGLLDAGGTVSPTGRVHYPATSHRLAEQVRELVVSLGYRCPLGRPAGRGKPVAGHLVSFGTGDDVFRDEPKLLAHKQRRRPGGSGRTGPRSIVDVRRVASVPVRCVAVDNPEHLYLAGRAMIPTHNSAASLDFARHAAVRHGLASAIFSLEMSKVEIVMRVLAAEARVPLHVLRSGQLSDEDWTKLARRMGEISEAPLFLDDTPNMTLMEIRAKARRLRQRHDLKLVVVDYLQLMTSPKRVESRQQEVSELSRGLKLLAKEIDCPVIGVAQLNRGPEQRTDKRPQLSDLRESGCLTAATRLVRADTNQEVTLGELVRSGATDVPVWSLDERLRYVPARLTHAFPSGRKQVFRLRLGSGREVAASANHPFLGYSGWVPLAELGPGDRVAVMRRLPGPPAARAWPREEVLRAARLARVPEEPIPDGVFALPTGQVALFLRQLWAAGGSAVAGSGGIRYRSASRRLLDGVAMLLLRFGIVAGVREVRSGPARGQHTLEVSGRDDQLRFLGEIGGRGAASGRLPAGLVAAPGDRAIDTVPGQLRTRVRELLAAAGVDHREPAAAGAAGPGGRPPGRCRPGRQPLARIAAVLDSADLELHATNDVCWDRVVSVEPLGEQQVYDATVPVTHNFVANGVAVHNSIEQDADVVILLHRDDYYDKESPRAGEADFIVAKHRNGPTDTVTVAAQLHFSRFVDMAIG